MSAIDERVRKLEKRVIAMDAAALVYARWAQAAIIVAEAVAETANIAPAALVARIGEIAARLPDTARPAAELAEIRAGLTRRKPS